MSLVEDIHARALPCCARRDGRWRRGALAQDRLQSSDLLKLRSVSARRGVARRDARRLHRREQRRRRPAVRPALGDDARRRQERSASAATRSRPATRSGRPTASRSPIAAASATRPGSSSRVPTAAARASSPRCPAPTAPLPTTGRTVAWSPDGKRIAFVSSVPGPETADATGDPIVITRYLYKPDAAEGMTRFNDNRRLHIFVVDVASGRSRAAHRRQLTTSTRSTGRRTATRSRSSRTASRTTISSSTTTCSR